MAKKAAPKKAAAKPKAPAEPCTHPIGRRIGKACAVCGATIGGK